MDKQGILGKFPDATSSLVVCEGQQIDPMTPGSINSADDERNPPELGLLDREIKPVKNGRVLLIPASDETAGHGTPTQARFWKKELGELLESAPRRAK